MLMRFFITSGTPADCTVAAQLIEGFQAKYLLADRGYDTDIIILKAVEAHMIPMIPPKKKLKQLHNCNEHRYKLCHLVEIAFLLLKRWWGIAMRYTKTNLASRFATLLIWLTIY